MSPPKRQDDEGRYGTVSDFDRPLDVEAAFRGRHNGGAGHGTLGDSRKGFVRLRRRGWDDLRRLAVVDQLTDHQVMMTIALLTRAGYRQDRMGVVLGTDRELALALGMHFNRAKRLWEALEALGIGQRLVLDSGERAGWRFDRQAWQWLAGEEDHPPPRPVAAILAAITGVDPHDLPVVPVP
jgi:hypothetical protein